MNKRSSNGYFWTREIFTTMVDFSYHGERFLSKGDFLLTREIFFYQGRYFLTWDIFPTMGDFSYQGERFLSKGDF